MDKWQPINPAEIEYRFYESCFVSKQKYKILIWQLIPQMDNFQEKN